MSTFPSASYDDWKLMTPEEEAERIFGRREEPDDFPGWLCAAQNNCLAGGPERGDDAPDECPECGGPVIVRVEPEEDDDDDLPF